MSLIREVEEIAKNKGYKSASSFVTDFILQGKTFGDLTDYLAIEHQIYSSYSNVHGQLRPLFRFPLRGRRYYNVLLYQARKEGKSIKEYVESIRDIPLPEVAKKLNLQSLDKLLETIESIHVGLVPAEKRPRASRKVNKHGFKQRSALYRWEKIARDLGYCTVKKAIRELEKENIPTKKIASLFGVTSQAYILRRKKIFKSLRKSR